jgi:hypothetical protein
MLTIQMGGVYLIQAKNQKGIRRNAAGKALIPVNSVP